MSSQRCYAPAIRFKPQWAYPTPPGYRDETFIVPFVFDNVPGNGQPAYQLPWTLDDDQPFIIRGIVFPQIGLSYLVPLNPGLCRIRDTHGNPLSEGLILSLGAWCQSGGQSGSNSGVGTNAFGFPIEPEIVCAPGGTLLFDFQLSTNASVANFFIAGVGVGIQFNAGIFGTAGNALSIELIDPGAPNIPLSVAVIGGTDVEVTLETDGAGVLVSTFQEVADIVNTQLAMSIMSATLSGLDVTDVMAASGPDALSGGNASTPIQLNGAFIGVKRFKDC